MTQKRRSNRSHKGTAIEGSGEYQRSKRRYVGRIYIGNKGVVRKC